jgi:hypothetical protein
MEKNGKKWKKCVFLTVAQTLAAVEAFEAGAVADGYMAALGTGRGVLLEMGQALAQGVRLWH